MGVTQTSFTYGVTKTACVKPQAPIGPGHILLGGAPPSARFWTLPCLRAASPRAFVCTRPDERGHSAPAKMTYHLFIAFNHGRRGRYRTASKGMASTRSSKSAGKLRAVGGGEDKEGECLVLKEFIRLAEGARAGVVVTTVASERAREVGAEYRAVFEKLGVDDVKVHVISHGFKFDLANRRPVSEEKERVEENAAGAEKAARPEADEGEVE